MEIVFVEIFICLSKAKNPFTKYKRTDPTINMDLNLIKHFQNHQIVYQTYKHLAVFTVEEAKKVDRHIPALHTKNLFLKEKSAGYFLVCLEAEKRLDIKNLSKRIGTKKLSFASANELQSELNLTPGSVSLFGMIYSKSTQLVLDQAILRAPAVGFHPNTNTATVVIDQPNLRIFLQSLNNPNYIEVEL